MTDTHKERSGPLLARFETMVEWCEEDVSNGYDPSILHEMIVRYLDHFIGRGTPTQYSYPETEKLEAMLVAQLLCKRGSVRDVIWKWLSDLIREASGNQEMEVELSVPLFDDVLANPLPFEDAGAMFLVNRLFETAQTRETQWILVDGYADRLDGNEVSSLRADYERLKEWREANEWPKLDLPIEEVCCLVRKMLGDDVEE